ncbi:MULTISPECIES: TadE family protein [Streptomyces]|uniref:TadE-like domain-containing protein n=2 Tax=Streptomyces TaxID=1883 RepID=A0ABP9A718_9ACTN
MGRTRTAGRVPRTAGPSARPAGRRPRPAARAGPHGRAGGPQQGRAAGPARFRLGDDRGQAAIEFTGMVPVVLATIVLLWQAALVGYSFSLAGHAADEAVRAGAVAEGDRAGACERAGRQDLPGAWSAEIGCWSEGDLVKATVDVRIPVLFPGLSLGIDAPGEAAAVRES